MTSEQRSHHSNAIALCRTHAKLIDSDEETYTIDLLDKWKKDHETEMMSHKIPETVSYPYEKPFEQCSAEELKEDLKRRENLLRREFKEKGIVLAPWLLVIVILYFILRYASFILTSNLWILIVSGIVVLLLKILHTKTEDTRYEEHRRNCIEEIKTILRNRGEKV